jgi:hypothetical protein
LRWVGHHWNRSDIAISSENGELGESSHLGTPVLLQEVPGIHNFSISTEFILSLEIDVLLIYCLAEESFFVKCIEGLAVISGDLDFAVVARNASSVLLELPCLAQLSEHQILKSMP